MKLISKITATVLVASLVVPAAFAATTAGTPRLQVLPRRRR